VHLILIALILVNSAPTSAAPVVSATRIDGESLAGELQSWDDQGVEIVSAEGKQRIAPDQLLSLRWPSAPAEKAADSPHSAHVELTDGSLIPIAGYQSDGTKASLELSTAMPGDGTTLELATKQVAAVQLQTIDTTVVDQWREIRNLTPAADVLVLLKQGGQSLDYVEGVLGNVSSERISFKLDGKTMKIDCRKIAGLIYYRPQRQTDGDPRSIVHGRSGLRANVVRAELGDGMLELTTIAGPVLRWPAADIYLADFSAGKLVYLSDMEPLSQRWTPLVGLPARATSAAEYGQPRRDRSAYGGPLQLSFADADSAAAKTRARKFNKGLALRSRTEIVYRLPAGFRRFQAVAGIDPATSASGNVRLAIHGDERLLWDAEISGLEPPQPIELDVAGVKRLKFIVDYGQNLDAGDWLNLCDARFLK
jgi:hypothetical protein